MKPKILLLADTGHQAAAVQDHIKAVASDDRYQWEIENPLLCKVLHKQDLSTYVAIGIHYSIKPYSSYYLPLPLFKALQQYNGYKFIFLQDEYRAVNLNIQTIVSLKMHTLFTLLDEAYHELAYAKLLRAKVQLIQVLTGYVDISLKYYSCLPFSERSTDIFYRSRHYPYWLGSLAQERTIIAEKLSQEAPKNNLSIDISLDEGARIYGDAWLQALATSKAVLGTESGASIWDVDGQIEKETKLFLSKHPNASFNKVHQEVLVKDEGNIRYAAISPRIFEAAATKTAMILFPGEYNGLLKANEHYISLEKDFSNIDVVCQQLKDLVFLEKITTNCHRDLIASTSYDSYRLGEIVANTIEQHRGMMLNVVGIESDLANIKRRYALINRWLVLVAELKFMATQFLNLLGDPSYKGINKFKILHAGFRRYLSYISARLDKS